MHQGVVDELVRVLIVDDDPWVLRLLSASFQDGDFCVLEAETGTEALRSVEHERPDVVLLDLGLPDLHGIEVIRQIRPSSEVPILVISAVGEESAKVEALEAGANDFMTKPFGLAELHARVRVALRQSHRNNRDIPPDTIEAGDVKIDVRSRRVEVRGSEVHLTPTEFNLLVALGMRAGNVVSHDQLLREVWGPEYVADTHYLRLYIGYLRRKIELEPDRPTLVLNEPRVGYRLLG